MDQILINFILPNDTNVEVNIPKNMYVQDALEQLVEKELIAPLQQGKEWKVAFKESGELVEINKTIEQNGITEGTDLRVAQSGKA